MIVHRRDISKALFATAAGSSVLLQRADAQTCTAPCYAQTAAESAASVTPTNLAYPPGNVLRYGAVGSDPSSAAADTLAFNNAAKVVKQGGGVLYVPAPPNSYYLNKPIDLTFMAPTSSNPNPPPSRGFVVRGEAQLAATQSGTDLPHIISVPAAVNQVAIFDCTGAQGITFENLSIGTLTSSSSNLPQTCWFLARTPNLGDDSQIHRFLNCRVIGTFTEALYYNYGIECDQIEGCSWQNITTSVAPTAKCCLWTGTNIRGLSSGIAPTVTGRVSCIDHKIMGGEFVIMGHGASNDVFYIEAANQLKILFCWTDCSDSAGGGRSILYIDNSNGMGSALGRIYGLEVENAPGGQQQYGILVSNPTAVADLNLGWAIRDCYLPAAVASIASAGANATIDTWTIEGVWALNTPVINFPGTVTASTINAPATSLTIGTSLQNSIFAWSGYTAITTRSKDLFFDTQNGRMI
jgi:hypothetical protein